MLLPSTIACAPRPGSAAQFQSFSWGIPVFGFFDDGTGKRVLELISTAAARAINSIRLASHDSDSRHCGRATSQRPGLIEYHHVQFAGTFERESVSYEETILRTKRC